MMESDRDLIIKYQALLENEKRRLHVGRFNSTDLAEKFENGEEESLIAECNRNIIDTSFVPHNESPEKSTTELDKQEIVPNVPIKTKWDINSNKERVSYFFFNFCFNEVKV